MAESTLEHYSDLAACLIRGDYPILPKPEWGQDTAFVAFVIDGLNTEVLRLRQGLWDIYATLGFDTDGDPTPRALVYPDIVTLVLDAAKEVREEMLQ